MQKIRIKNRQYLSEVINSSERLARVLRELNSKPEIINNAIAVNYSDEGYALFQVIGNLPEVLTVEFTGTAC